MAALTAGVIFFAIGFFLNRFGVRHASNDQGTVSNQGIVLK